MRQENIDYSVAVPKLHYFRTLQLPGSSLLECDARRLYERLQIISSFRPIYISRLYELRVGSHFPGAAGKVILPILLNSFVAQGERLFKYVAKKMLEEQRQRRSISIDAHHGEGNDEVLRVCRNWIDFGNNETLGLPGSSAGGKVCPFIFGCFGCTVCDLRGPVEETCGSHDLIRGNVEGVGQESNFWI